MWLLWQMCLSKSKRNLVHGVIALLLAAGIGVSAVPSAEAQDRPVVFVHGFMSNGGTWAGAASRLQGRLAIAADTPTLSSTASYETQGAELEAQVGFRGHDIIAVGHSNGGIVSREWSKWRPLFGIVTLGTPHGGAPIISNAYEYAGFTGGLAYSFNNLYRFFGRGCCDWQWILNAYDGVWQAVWSAAVSALPQIGAAIAVNATIPVSLEMQSSSSYLASLNGGDNLAREAEVVPARVGIVSTAHNFYYGGVLRAAFPDDGDTVFAIREIARVSMEAYAATILASADIGDHNAFAIANAMLRVAYYLGTMDEVWCRAVSVPGMGACWANDTIVPQWSQVYPNAAFVDTGWSGPAHTQQPRMSDALIEQTLWYMGVPPRSSPPPPPPPDPGPDPGPDPNPESLPVRLYWDVGFDGAYYDLDGDQPFVGWDWNDMISGVHVPPGRTVVLYEHVDFGGQSLELTSDAPDLRAYGGPGRGGTWNDVVSSIRVY